MRQLGVSLALVLRCSPLAIASMGGLSAPIDVSLMQPDNRQT